MLTPRRSPLLDLPTASHAASQFLLPELVRNIARRPRKRGASSSKTCLNQRRVGGCRRQNSKIRSIEGLCRQKAIAVRATSERVLGIAGIARANKGPTVAGVGQPPQRATNPESSRRHVQLAAQALVAMVCAKRAFWLPGLLLLLSALAGPAAAQTYLGETTNPLGSEFVTLTATALPLGRLACAPRLQWQCTHVLEAETRAPRGSQDPQLATPLQACRSTPLCPHQGGTTLAFSMFLQRQRLIVLKIAGPAVKGCNAALSSTS